MCGVAVSEGSETCVRVFRSSHAACTNTAPLRRYITLGATLMTPPGIKAKLQHQAMCSRIVLSHLDAIVAQALPQAACHQHKRTPRCSSHALALVVLDLLRILVQRQLHPCK